MAEKYNLIHERVDDIPLLIGLAQRLRLPEIIDKQIGNHGHHQGLSNGHLTIVWLAYILSEGDHRKYSVEDWAKKHQNTLEQLLSQPIREVEFNDDRLEIVLRRLSQAKAWEAMEVDLWSSTVAVYKIEMSGVRLDSTTTYGYHRPTEDGLMQYGYSKDHRPDLPQLKLMAAGAEPSGHLLCSEVLAGHKADDPLYLPMLRRVRQTVSKSGSGSGLLYVGDSKMAAVETRADIVAHGDYYLMPLPLTGETGMQMETWIDAVVDGEQTVDLIWDQGRLLGGGYEFERCQMASCQMASVAAEQVKWTERVEVIRSSSRAEGQIKQLEQRLSKAEAQLQSLTPPPGRGKRQYREESILQAAVAQLLEDYKVAGLLHVTWQRQEEAITHYLGRGRGSANRPKQTDVRIRYVITAVQRDHSAIQRRHHRLGWHAQVTNLPVDKMSLAEVVIHYRGGLEFGTRLSSGKRPSAGY